MSPARRSGRSAALAGLFAVLILLVTPGIAVAHGTAGLENSDYRVSVTSVPGLPGLEVRPVEAASRLELTNTGDLPVEVLGYSGEPYLLISPDGVFVNVFSPAAYLNETATGATAVPAYAAPSQAPYWQKATDEPRVRWFDHRAHWMNEAPPAQVAGATTDQRILDWTIPLRVGVTPYQLTGTLDWVAPPSAGTWAALTMLAGAAVVFVGVSTRIPDRVARLSLASAAAVAGAAAVADAIGRAITSQDLQTGWFKILFTAELWPLFGGAVSVAAAAYAFARKPAADLALGVAGVCLGMFAGLSRIPSFAYAVTPTPWSGDVDRVLIVAGLGLGTGLAVGALVRARRKGQMH
ncbi:hypothetical protein Afil01_68290 [Actinorhabdospora filicis]|uniref:Uncharacterized protein n=1 Tax=Actinorhabdospora filicis TaxID=1785913 RepID=A0A9W6SUE7_9ACTN|nr:hypothetical protein [Actinorhabdospora filicis]GLZ82022.1 hypothetical protein Afil01_68290 [Actinorhabdospora filicis]